MSQKHHYQFTSILRCHALNQMDSYLTITIKLNQTVLLYLSHKSNRHWLDFHRCPRWILRERKQSVACPNAKSAENHNLLSACFTLDWTLSCYHIFKQQVKLQVIWSPIESNGGVFTSAKLSTLTMIFLLLGIHIRGR
jgi:hypothetical protein